MDRELIRLEILKVTFRKDQTIEMNITCAKMLENYVFEKEAESAAQANEISPSPKKAGGKKSGNPDLLS